MTREIKFRYWNVGRRVMIENVGFHPHILMNIDAMEDWEEEYKPDSPGSIIRNEKSEYGILMQFTGLQDNNGADIYEGDILQSEKGHTGKVVWISATASFAVECADGIWSLNEGDISRDTQLTYTSVIGNIYQQPDLINTLNVEE